MAELFPCILHAHLFGSADKANLETWALKIVRHVCVRADGIAPHTTTCSVCELYRYRCRPYTEVMAISAMSLLVCRGTSTRALIIMRRMIMRPGTVTGTTSPYLCEEGGGS